MYFFFYSYLKRWVSLSKDIWDTGGLVFQEAPVLFTRNPKETRDFFKERKFNFPMPVFKAAALHLKVTLAGLAKIGVRAMPSVPVKAPDFPCLELWNIFSVGSAGQKLELQRMWWWCCFFNPHSSHLKILAWESHCFYIVLFFFWSAFFKFQWLHLPSFLLFKYEQKNGFIFSLSFRGSRGHQHSLFPG